MFAAIRQLAHSEHVTAQKEPRMAATLVTVGRKAGRLTADQTLCMSGRAGFRSLLRKQSTLRAIQWTRSFGEERSHLVLLGFDAAQNLVLFMILTDLFRPCRKSHNRPRPARDNAEAAPAAVALKLFIILSI